MGDARYLSVKEVADRFGISLSLTYKLIHLREDDRPLPKRNGWFPKHQRAGSQARFHEDEVARAEKEFLEADWENV